jgi:hypothetical protein
LHGQPHACERQDNGESEGRKVDHHAVPIGVLSLFPAFVFGERFVRVGRLRAARRALACAEAAGSEWDDPVVIVCRLGPLSCHVRFRFGRPVSRLYRRQCEISSKTEITFAAKLCAVTHGLGRAAGSPGEEKIPVIKPKIPCRLRCPGLNLREIYGSDSLARLSPAFQRDGARLE